MHGYAPVKFLEMVSLDAARPIQNEGNRRAKSHTAKRMPM